MIPSATTAVRTMGTRYDSATFHRSVRLSGICIVPCTQQTTSCSLIMPEQALMSHLAGSNQASLSEHHQVGDCLVITLSVRVGILCAITHNSVQFLLD